MSEDIPKRVIDITGVELTPGEPDVCLGNGEQGFECCCDECDYLLLCFPAFDEQNYNLFGENRRFLTLILQNTNKVKVEMIVFHLHSFFIRLHLNTEAPRGNGI